MRSLASDARARREVVHAYRDELLTRHAERSLHAFIRQAWDICEPSTEYLDNWHIAAIAEYLEAVSAGDLRRLVINLPPRYMKSLIVSVFWPTWLWITRPETRWMFASYSDSLAVKHSLDRRRILQSPWYQWRWGTRFRLTGDQNVKTEYHNDRRGVMLATSVGGTATGKGGNFLVVDDPHNPKQAESDALREQALEFFSKTLSTRLDDKRRGVIVVVMQRLHHCDLSALCLQELGYEHLCLPAIADSTTTIVLPRSRQQITRDTGSPLWPTREGLSEIAEQKRVLGGHAFQAQYQQRPVPRAGMIFKREWWRYYDTRPELDVWAQSWDMAFKDTAGSDYVVGLVGGKKRADYYVVDRIKDQLSFTASCRAVESLAGRYPHATRVLIEDKANGPAIIDTLRHRVSGVLAVNPQGGKIARAGAVEPLVEAGNVYLPNPVDPQTGHDIPERAWVRDFIDQLAMFPQGAHDDDVDAFTQLLLHLHHSTQDAFLEFLRGQYERAHAGDARSCS